MAPERISSNLPISSRRRMPRTTGPLLRRHPMITRGMAAAWSDAAEEDNEHIVQPLAASAVQHEFKEEIFAYMKESDAILHTQKNVVDLLQERAVTLKDEKAVLQRTLVAETAARKEIFQCPICLELAWNPHILECGHSFCSKCLSQYKAHHALRREEEEIDTDVPIRCPTCRACVRRTPVHSKTIQRGVEFVAKDLGMIPPPYVRLEWPA